MKRTRFFRRIVLGVFAGILAAAALPSGNASAAVMNQYCQVPPYVVQNIPPNVLILLDISRSMQYFAYYDGYGTPDNSSDDRYGTTSNAPCMNYNWSGRPSTYYGYFDSTKWYTYSSGVFVEVGTIDNIVNPTNRPTGGWSGDFLNWLTMRRMDIMRKVLTGGRPTSDKIDGQPADSAEWGLFKRITRDQAQLYTPFVPLTSKDVLFVFLPGSSGTSKFDAYQTQNQDPANGTYTSSDKITSQVANQSIAVNVRVPLPVEGVLQQTVGARARVGLMFFTSSGEGGTVITDVGKDKGNVSSLSDTINQINLSSPSVSATPLAEALWSATGYFAQQATIPAYNSPSGTGPMYSSGDYSVNANNDPVNFGTGGQPRYPLCQKEFVLLLTDGEPCFDGNLPTNVFGYGSASSFNCTGTSCPATSGPGYSFPAQNTTSIYCPSGATSGVEDVALFLHTKDLRNSPAIGLDNISGFQNLTLYTVFAFGKGSTLLKYAAINGGFENSGPTEIPSTGSTSNWDKDGNGEPDTYYQATEGAELESAVRDAMSNMLKRASSGTAASVLASGEGSGANLIQAVFYPRRKFGNDIVWWTGSLQNLWYYVDPFYSNATIREESVVDSKLDLTNDKILEFFFNPDTELTQVYRWADNNGDGVADSSTPESTVDFESLGNLWEAGKLLWGRDLSTNGRTIYTNLYDTSTMFDFSESNVATLAPYILPDAGDNVATIIRYVHGYDNPADLNYRDRSAAFGIDNQVWKLGDIVNSTPRIVSGIALNKYDSIYYDTTYKTFTETTGYLNRGMVFTGGNDGILHAFRLGKLELSWPYQTQSQKAWISNPYYGTTLGDEAWGFIPKNALPYLKYLKNTEYCHLYYTDLSPYVFDASIGGNANETRTSGSWRTVLIGGMRTGGACANVCTTGQDCVPTPATDKGFSSYFGLDVTNPETPTLLWEFSSPYLGFTTTGPAIVRVDGLDNTGTRNRALNGEWYAVFGSGPTGPIDNTNNQFLGRSNQNLRFFIVNLRTGAVAQTIDTGIPYAFAGSMINSVADFNLDYQDDAIYVGYIKRETGTSPYTWTDGGVGRIVTKNITPNNTTGWAFSRVIDGIGPVSTSVARLQNNTYSTNWLFFGTGRYYFEIPPSATAVSPEVDDATGQRRLFGLKEPCFTVNNTINTTCTTTVAFSLTDTTFPNVTDINDVPSEAVANSSGFKGWFLDLDPSSTIGTTSTYYTYDNETLPYRAERIITDPLATTTGTVYFTSYKPYADECALGGKSFLWALRYNTGGSVSSAVLKGKALVQVSTASVEQIDLSKAFTPAAGEAADGEHKSGRRTSAIEGVPPTAQGLSLLSQPPPVKRIMHMMER